MHINVRDFLAQDVGYHRTFAITDERPNLSSLTLTQPINGQIEVTALEDDQILVRGRLSTELELECHRCLRSYNAASTVELRQIFSPRPGDDELPIKVDQIDLAPLIEQELIVALPIKQICGPDCPGITKGQY